ncbi:hypothetical protein EJ04DRAFT_162380 [Polyplosphaeria fusca]|uniref:MHYT domain-containing protein n=1 Tax=Polyplosphaeria fusca TaxID=682080 RepID=A0A9P4RBV4_9PLEO|nr:hypothetical protein EJ04DRAFT_162380 [Polyplosphaeria fusca]
MQGLPEKYPIGSFPAIHYTPHLVIISYIVSLVGAYTTVELLHRRVSGSGWRNVVQLAGCSVSFGLVAIWCMHFVGNRAIVLGDGEESIQLFYNPSFTAISAILAVAVIFLGLAVADRFYKGNKRQLVRNGALVACGVFTGAAITGMHYVGNFGTTNYSVKPIPRFVAGATIIAVCAATFSYALFFHWSGRWINTWWRRCIVACVLAMAVCGMHWTAAIGTRYELQGYHQGPGEARNTNLIIAICFSLGACGVCGALGALKQRYTRKLKDRAQQVVLAVATFDSEGRILVTQGGLMPCQTITKQFHQRIFDEDFNNSHSVFQWIFRVSRNWGGIIELIPSMRDHLQTRGYLQTFTPAVGGSTSRTSFGTEDETSYSATFRELFCVTAYDIARSLNIRLQDLGVLYEDVLPMGTLLTKTVFKDTSEAKNYIATDVSHSELEAGTANPILFGKGQLLIVTRKVDNAEANRLEDSGYRFATLEQVGETLARSLQVSREDLKNTVDRLQMFCQRKPWAPSKGTYLSAFLLQPSPVLTGLDVIVPRSTPDRLPMVRLAKERLTKEQLQLLRQFNCLTLDECLVRIDNRRQSGHSDDFWLEKFRNRIRELTREVPEPALRQAIFSAQPVNAAYGSGRIESSDAVMFAFCGIKDVYNQTTASQILMHVPMSLFQCYQRISPTCQDHAILAQKNHKEFSTLITSASTESCGSPSSRARRKWHWRLYRSKSSSEMTINPDSSSEKGLVNDSVHATADSANTSHPFGGIMVSQEVVIKGDQKHVSQMELLEMGVRTEAGVAGSEQATLADKLIAITSSLRDARGLRESGSRKTTNGGRGL